MPEIFAAAAVVLLMALVVFRVGQMKKLGIRAMRFGELDKTDFLIPPFALFYFYLIFAGALRWPRPDAALDFPPPLRWTGVFLCLAALVLMAAAIRSFGKSFRVGIDEDKPGELVTAGAFSLSRNPIYVAFFCILLGNLLVYPSALMLIYALAGFWLINRQVLREEDP
jgi:protein-S-isoprenylcysteine O-methyltransferase Ste14